MANRGLVGVARSIVMVIGAVCAACVQSSSVNCEDGSICPSARVCSVHGCVLPSQLAACVDLPNGSDCTLPDQNIGNCVDGVCLTIGCGNRVVESSEACDDGNTLGGDGCSARCDSNEMCGNAFLDTAKSEGCDCGAADFTGARPPGCNGKPNSDAPDTVCTATCQIRGCGDGVVGGLEDCDGADQPLTSCRDAGFYLGTLGCLPTCRYDDRGCTGKCRDNERNGPPGEPLELCDGIDLNGRDCTSYGYYNPVGLICNDLCTFDIAACTGYCGDGSFDSGDEVCDPGEDEAELAARGLDCKDYGFYAPTGLACADTCQIDTSGCGGGFCGDGIQQGTEDCDGADLGGVSCSLFGYYQTGGLACRDNCTFDLAGCTERCGDSTVNGPEQCDAADLGGADCTTLGFYNPSNLSCNDACSFDTTACVAECGDGIRQSAFEQCDGADVGNATCISLGFYTGGPVRCNSLCSLDASSCSGYCGDGIKNGTDEQCDGSDLANADCTDLSYYNAPGLACNAVCAFDDQLCTGRCGDNIKNGPDEQCDGPDLAGSDCMTFDYYNRPGLACNEVCGYDTTTCTGYCGDDLKNGIEVCDPAPPAEHCLDYGYDTGPLECSAFCTPDFADCGMIGWDFDRDFPTPSLDAVWGVGAELFVVGFSGKIWHFNGTVWVAMTSPTTNRLTSVWGTSRTDVFAVGVGGTIIHYDGNAWTTMTSGTTITLSDVWGSSPNDVYVVGGGSFGLIRRYNGTTWSTVTGGGSNGLEAVWGSGPTDVFAVGLGGSIRHFDGTAWTAMVSGTVSTLFDVWGTSSTNVFVVGPSVILHYNGNAWTTMTSPTGYGFVALAGSSAIDVFAFGGSGAIVHYDGVAWRSLESPETNTWTAAWNGAPGQQYAITGDRGYRYSGMAWAPVASPTTEYLTSVWADGSDVFAVGGEAHVVRQTGATWSLTMLDVANPLAFNSVHGTSRDDVLVVGAASHRFDGTTWSDVSGAVGLKDVWASGPSDAYAVGSSGRIEHFDGSAWTPMTSGTTSGFLTVWGFGANEVYAGGVAYRRYDGTTWSAPSGPSGGGVTNSLWGSSPSDLFAAETGGFMQHFNGTAWMIQPTLTTYDLLGVAGTGPTDVWAVGKGGTILHYDGSRWGGVNSGVVVDLFGVWAAPERIIFVGANGTIRYLVRSTVTVP